MHVAQAFKATGKRAHCGCNGISSPSSPRRGEKLCLLQNEQHLPPYSLCRFHGMYNPTIPYRNKYLLHNQRKGTRAADNLLTHLTVPFSFSQLSNIFFARVFWVVTILSTRLSCSCPSLSILYCCCRRRSSSSID